MKDITPQEHPEIIIAVSLSIEGCKCLQNTADARTFAQCLSGTGEKHGIRSAKHDDIIVHAKVKVGHETVCVQGEVHEYRALAAKAPHARHELRSREA